MKQQSIKTKPFNTKRSLERSGSKKLTEKKWTLSFGGKEYVWASRMDRVEIIREGIPYGSIEVVSKRLKKPLKSMLSLVGLPQTKYNKEKDKQSLLDSRKSELVIMISELLDFGVEVFNNEEDKFQNWLKKPNLSLGGNTPESLLDAMTGIDEVRYCLNRIEYGNVA